MKRSTTEIENLNISEETPRLFSIRSGVKFYQVWLGSDIQLPTCQCIDYRTNKLPCKHICAVVQQPNVGWESLGSRFNSHPLFILDKEVIGQSTQVPESSHDISDDTFPSNQTELTDKDGSPGESKVEVAMVSLPCRKKGNIRRQCIQEVKTLHDELYLLTDKDALNETLQKIREVLAYARKHRPKENGLLLKDKSLSPKKPTNLRVSKLERRKKRDHLTKRVGKAADFRNAKIVVEEGKVGQKIGSKAKKSNIAPRKRVKAQNFSVAGKRRRNDEDENGNRPNDIWITIDGVKLTYELRDILQCTFSWLTDEHIDAAQHLIKELGTGVSGLNCIAATTHCSRFAVRQDVHQTIQCHNIGAHWVTSTSISGKVVVYESLYSTVNESLKRQLAYVYEGLCNGDGSLNVTVVLQQRQRGASDCGLFAIANSVALATGVDPSTIHWDQSKMRDHLLKCFEEQKIRMFPHDVMQKPYKQSHYVISTYCVCLRHIPGAQMVHCSVCDNWFHHGHAEKCMKLSPKQVAALATGSPLICTYCEQDRRRKPPNCQVVDVDVSQPTDITQTSA